MSEPKDGFTPDAAAYAALVVVPILSGFLLQFLLAPDAASPGWFETFGIIVGVLLAAGRAVSKWLNSSRVYRRPR
ncbi:MULTISPECIES: hypothetical protein [unclassified Microbacterium]|uniref:hypothetical protein n=1 Tax=unclassified Microbacterium TaxID=2609290 RepID=UPI0024696538|nr:MULTISPECIES: hypothetical protein [unclassified Microbacterium]MDH5134086.1 hypothetical protein [Microbacterium sp. RD10]MDH5136810.1 hypothetical protein [Microbacterium sp. RD11]MDH5146409.1 hypothetical protein [Microbacterium sp. RD12]MDH5155143.1 hypothetical protein [Microbacterium sp. RD06]MDH5166575.1 hypothetical protein [Microbacterium sp. RD02]